MLQTDIHIINQAKLTVVLLYTLQVASFRFRAPCMHEWILFAYVLTAFLPFLKEDRFSGGDGFGSVLILLDGKM